MGGYGFVRCGKEGRYEQIESAEKGGDEVELQTESCKGLHGLVIVAVEYARDAVRAEEYCDIYHDRHCKQGE